MKFWLVQNPKDSTIIAVGETDGTLYRTIIIDKLKAPSVISTHRNILKSKFRFFESFDSHQYTNFFF